MSIILRVKEIARLFLPEKLRIFIGMSIPKFFIINTYILKNPQKKNFTGINSKFFIRKLKQEDIDALREAESYRNPSSFNNKIPPRLNSLEWIGLAVFDNSNGEIAYLAWIISRSIPYFEEFGIHLKKKTIFT